MHALRSVNGRIWTCRKLSFGLASLRVYFVFLPNLNCFLVELSSTIENKWISCYIAQFTNHECIGIHEFTNKYFNFHEFTNDIFSFHESRTTSFSRIHEQFFSFSRTHERKKANSRLHERRWGGLVLQEIGKNFFSNKQRADILPAEKST